MARTKEKTVVKQTASRFTRKATADFKVSGPDAGPSAHKEIEAPYQHLRALWHLLYRCKVLLQSGTLQHRHGPVRCLYHRRHHPLRTTSQGLSRLC